MGNGYLRRLLVVGATSVTRRAPTTDTRTGAWVRSLLGRKPTRLVTIAIANKTARTAWAMLTRRDDYRAAAVVRTDHERGSQQLPTRNAGAEVNDDDQTGPQPCPPRGVVRAFERVDLIGTRFADFIRASGHMHRANRPDK
jgi:hypothetical protein